jgi:tetratricopeptide (TPR) repeat protein
MTLTRSKNHHPINAMRIAKHIFWIAGLFLLSPGMISPTADSASSFRLFQEASERYSNGDIENALNLYEQLQANGIKNSTILYNMGNCYFRLQHIGKAIAYYKVALFLNPRNQDIKENLRYVRTLTRDQIEAESSLETLLFFYHRLNANELAILSMAFATIFWIVLIIRRFKNTLLFSRPVLFTCCFLAIAASTSLWFKHHQWDWFGEGVIIAGKAAVYSANSQRAMILFSLNEGAEVHIKDDRDKNWVRIFLEQNKQGWVERDSILPLKALMQGNSAL